MMLALEFWGPPFQFSLNVFANLLVFVAKLVGIPQLGLQRHLASKGPPKASKGVPRRSPGRPKGGPVAQLPHCCMAKSSFSWFFLASDKTGNFKMQKLGSGLVVQSFFCSAKLQSCLRSFVWAWSQESWFSRALQIVGISYFFARSTLEFGIKHENWKTSKCEH